MNSLALAERWLIHDRGTGGDGLAIGLGSLCLLALLCPLSAVRSAANGRHVRVDVLLFVRCSVVGLLFLSLGLVDLARRLLRRRLLAVALLIRDCCCCIGELGKEMRRVDARPDVKTALSGVFCRASEPKVLRVGAGVEGDDDIAITSPEGDVGDIEVGACSSGGQQDGRGGLRRAGDEAGRAGESHNSPASMKPRLSCLVISSGLPSLSLPSRPLRKFGSSAGGKG